MKQYLTILFFLIFFIHLFFSLQGIDHTLLHRHSFRQTQTAISTYYTIQEGYQIAYQTPVLGKPWSVPMEFPTYQWIVAFFTKLTGLNLDFVGRTVSLFFFYLSIYFLYKTIRIFNETANSLVLILLIMCSPIYIFWSRTFMIESLSFYLSITYIYYFIRSLTYISFKSMFLASLIGILAGITKLTTFAIFLLGAYFYFIYCWILETDKFSRKKLFLYLLYFIFFFIVPIMFTTIWVQYADYLKNQNPLAIDLLTSKSTISWNFGTLDQKLSLETYKTISEFYLPVIIGNWLSKIYYIPIIVLVILFFSNRINFLLSLLFLFLFLSGPLIFTNLYLVHDYYYYANSIFLLLFIGNLFSILISIKKYHLNKIVFFIILPFLIFNQLKTYYKIYYPLQLKNDTEILSLKQIIKENIPFNSIILIYGHDWNSEIPYYIQRKAIMDRKALDLKDSSMKKSIELSGKENISAVLISGENSQDLKFVQERIDFFQLESGAVYNGRYGKLYIKNKDIILKK